MAAKLCINCGGTGEVSIPYFTPMGIGGIWRSKIEKCKHCNGLGSIGIKQKC